MWISEFDGAGVLQCGRGERRNVGESVERDGRAGCFHCIRRPTGWFMNRLPPSVRSCRAKRQGAFLGYWPKVQLAAGGFGLLLSRPIMQKNHACAASVSGLGTVCSIEDDDSVRTAPERLWISAGIRSRAFASADEFLRAGASPDGSCVITGVKMHGSVMHGQRTFSNRTWPDPRDVGEDQGVDRPLPCRRCDVTRGHDPRRMRSVRDVVARRMGTPSV